MFNLDLIDQLSKGNIIIKYDKSIDSTILNDILTRAFPVDPILAKGVWSNFRYFGKSSNVGTFWTFYSSLKSVYSLNYYGIPIVDIREFIIKLEVDEC